MIPPDFPAFRFGFFWSVVYKTSNFGFKVGFGGTDFGFFQLWGSYWGLEHSPQSQMHPQAFYFNTPLALDRIITGVILSTQNFHKNYFKQFLDGHLGPH